MANKKRGLGRGLDALLAGAASAADPAVKPQSGDRLTSLPVEMLQRGVYQPRIDMRTETLQELAESIRAQGVIQPLIVRPIDHERYEIIAGERRWRAAQLAQLHEVPVVVRDVPDQAAMAMALIENIQREDLNPLEEAKALLRLRKEFDLTHQDVADAVGRSRAAVTNLMRLMDLDEDVKALLESGELEMGHARALLALSGDEQIRAASEVVKKQLSVRQTEALVRSGLQRNNAVQSNVRPDPDVIRLQEDLSDRLGARVVVQSTAGGRGKLVVHYHSLDELDGILDRIK